MAGIETTMTTKERNSMLRMTGKRRALSLWVALCVLSGGMASANVSIRNGNFFIAYTDIVYQGGLEPKVERVYNSKTPYKTGMFGPGWGTEYETYLTVSADGSVVVHESGGGAENRFVPAAFKSADLDEAVKRIVAVAKTVGTLGSAKQAEAYAQKLQSNVSFRNEEWERFVLQGKLKARDLAVGSQLSSGRFSYQYITRLKAGYQRVFDSGRVESFDDAGRLSKVAERTGNFVDLAYGKDGKLQKLQDNFNRKMFFTFNSAGLLEKVEGENGKKALYEYNGDRELAKSTDAAGNVFTFKYSTDKQHNLVQVGYSDKTAMDVAYHGVDKFQNVKSVKARDGVLTEYDYSLDPADKGHLKVGVNSKDSQGQKLTGDNYEYFLKYRADGEEWTYKLVTVSDGDKTETIYNECCGLPLIIKQSGEETSFQYDVKGRVTKKTTPSEITHLTYDQKLGKVTKVVRNSKIDKKLSVWSQFQYDGAGNLVFAKNSESKGVKLFYDATGRISSMIDQDKRRLDFKYNENSKPVEISDPSMGTITVSYNTSGEIQKVDSTAGKKVALQVTSAFQNLLDIIRPAGVSLTF